MAYEFETSAFSELGNAMRDYPEGISREPERLRTMVELYLQAAKALFLLMSLIMVAKINQSKNGDRFRGFLDIYDERVQALLQQLASFLNAELQRGNTEVVHEFLEGVRQGAIHQEMEQLQYAISLSSGTGEDLETDESGTTTVMNSLKEQIERRIKQRWIKDILHAINEIVSVVKAVI